MKGAQAKYLPRLGWRRAAIGFLGGLAAVNLFGCQMGSPNGDPAAVAACLNQYHLASPDPMPASGPFSGAGAGVTYAVPCDALAPAGDGRWSVLVVAPNDLTIRIYFIGGPPDRKCGLLKRVSVVETSSDVKIQLEMGADPTFGPNASCSADGANYVTQISLAKPLRARKVSGQNNEGVIEHLN